MSLKHGSNKYIEAHSFKKVDIIQFNNDIKEKFGFDFYPYLNDWFNGKEQPGFLFTNLQTNEIIVGDRSRYQVTFIASNPEPVAGLFNISFRTGGAGMDRQSAMAFQQRGGGGGGGNFSISMQGRGMEAEDISKIVLMDPDESKRIGIVLDAQPRAMMINTLFAQNIPGEINLPINDIIKTKGNAKEFSGEEILPVMQPFLDPSEIVVDNEDPGFISSKQNTVSPLKRLLKIKNKEGSSYTQLSLM